MPQYILIKGVLNKIMNTTAPISGKNSIIVRNNDQIVSEFRHQKKWSPLQWSLCPTKAQCVFISREAVGSQET